jgi:hypothetical protein
MWRARDLVRFGLIAAGIATTFQSSDADSIARDLVVDFGKSGLWEFVDNSKWQKISSVSPTAVSVGDLDGNGDDDAVVSFNRSGLWVHYNGANWAKIHNSPARRFVAGDLDGTGKDDLVVDFGAAGIWVRYNNNTKWKKLHSASSQILMVGDFDGQGRDDLLVDFGAAGLWQMLNNSTWRKINNGSPRAMSVGDLDGNGKSEVVASFAGAGLWARYNNNTWLKLHSYSPANFFAGDLDGNGKDELVVDFDANGLWTRFNNAVWRKLHRASPINAAAADLDGNGEAEAVVNFGAAGLWVLYNKASWRQVSKGLAQIIEVGNFERSSSTFPVFPNADNTGVPKNWQPVQTFNSTQTISQNGAVVQDIRITSGDLRIAADNVIVRRVELLNGRITNDSCHDNLLVEDSSVLGHTSSEGAIGPGSYTARRVRLDGVPEGFRVGAKPACGAVRVEDSFVHVTPPSPCGDWHGDGLQGYGGPPLVIRNVTIDFEEGGGCYGTAPFFYPANQGNTSVDVDGLIVRGGGYSFRLGMPGKVRNLRVVNRSWTYGPIQVNCSVLSDWSAEIVTIDSDYQPTATVSTLRCN